ncbi:MAG: MCP four helix bundle domain-containing protein, partial [Chloroflexi bacterium]|nr:MCP four helix bundle domain-containing protein [Chloroflexota bacterium]
MRTQRGGPPLLNGRAAPPERDTSAAPGKPRHDAVAADSPHGPGQSRRFRLGVRNRLFLGFGVVLSLLCVTAFSGARYVTYLRTEFVEMYQNNFQAMVELSEAEAALWEMRQALPQYVAQGPDERKRILTDEARLLQAIDDNLRSYSAGERTADERRGLKDWETAYSQYLQARQKWFETFNAGKLDEAADFRTRTTTPLGGAADKVLLRLMDLQQQGAADAHRGVLGY